MAILVSYLDMFIALLCMQLQVRYEIDGTGAHVLEKYHEEIRVI